MINCVQHRRLCLRSVCRKSMFFQKKRLFSIPIRTLCGLCVLQSLWAFYLGILAETPNPFPLGRGYFAGATAPRPSKDACSQPHKATMQGRIMTATQSRCTMQRHKWLSMHRCSGTNGRRPVRGLRPKARTLWLLAKSYKQGRLCQLNRAVARCNGTNS